MACTLSFARLLAARGRLSALSRVAAAAKASQTIIFGSLAGKTFLGDPDFAVVIGVDVGEAETEAFWLERGLDHGRVDPEARYGADERPDGGGS